MHIALGAEALSPQLTGIGRYTWELIRRLPEVADIDSIRLYRENAWFDNGERFLHDGYSTKRCLPRKLRNWLDRNEFKKRLFHGPNFFSPPQAENVVITVHDLSVFRFPETHPIERVQQFEKEFRRSIDNARHIITDTIYIKEELVEMFGIRPARISAIPLGVSNEFFSTGAPEAEAEVLARHGLTAQRYCLCVATIEPRKGLAHAVQAFLRYQEKAKDDTILVIVGAAGWNNSELHELFEKVAATGALKFLGFISDPDLRTIYRRSSLFIYPSLYEGFGLPVLEAMASKVPVITSDQSCLPEVSGGVAMCVDVEDYQVFEGALAKGLGDEDWRKEAVQKGLDLAKRLNWDRCALETAEVYRNLL